MCIRHSLYQLSYNPESFAHFTKFSTKTKTKMEEELPTIRTFNMPDGSIFAVKKGIAQKQINQLIEYSHTDKDVLEFTHDSRRFNNLESFNLWKGRGTFVYTLLDEANNLLGIIWYEALYLPYKNRVLDHNPKEFGITFAIRLYGGARGKGLGVPFTKATLEDFKKSELFNSVTNKGIWLSVKKDNIPAIKVYEHSGFKSVGPGDNPERILMVLV